MAEEEGSSAVGETLTSDDHDNSYQLDFDYESPIRPPRRWSSLNNNSAPQMMSASASNLFKSPRRSVSSSAGVAHHHQQQSTTANVTHTATTTSFHDSMSTVTATTSSGSFLRSNFKAQTKSTSTSASQWQLPTAASATGGETPDWMRKLKHSKGGDAEPAAARQEDAADETLPEWKKKFLEMKGGSSSAADEVTCPEKLASPSSPSSTTSQKERGSQSKPVAAGPEAESSTVQKPGLAAASATPEWKRKFLQMKIATDAAQLHDEEALRHSPGAGNDGDGGTAGSAVISPSSPSSLPTWKKSIVKSRHVQAELLSLGLRESSKAVNPSDAVPKAKGHSAAKENDGTPEWMKKFQSMKFEKEESVIEAGGKQDPGVVTNGNGVVVSWMRSTTTQTTTAVSEATENQHSLASTTKAKTRRVDVTVEREPPESTFLKPNAPPVRSKSDSSDRPATATNEVFCQLCDRRGHSAKECPKLLATSHEPVESAMNADPPLDEQVKEKKKKKKSKLVQEMIEGEETATFYGSNGAAHIEAATVDTGLAPSCDPVSSDELTSEPGKKKKKKKKLADSETTEEIDPTAATPQLDTGSLEACAPATPSYAEISQPEHCQEIVEGVAVSKKKKKKRAAALAENKAVVEDPSPARTEDESPGQEPSAETAQTKNADECDGNAAMNESFSFSELSSDPAKARRKKKTSKKVDSEDCIGENTFDSQSEVSKAGAATEATVPMNESYSSTGDSSTDLNRRDRSSNMKKMRRKKKGKDEPVGPMSDSCSSLESSVVSSHMTGPTTVNSVLGEGKAGSASRSASKGGSRSPRVDDGYMDGPETCSTSQQSSCAGSKSSSSRESTLSSRCSNSKQNGPSDVSRTAKERILEERIQIVNTLNAFLDQTKERMANRESRIPEGSLRANKDDGKAGHQQERRASVGVGTNPSEGTSRTNTKKTKSQLSARAPHRRRSCTGGSGTQSAQAKREGSRRTETSGQPPSSPRRRPGQAGKAPSRRRVARDPEPDLKPAKEVPDAACEDVFRVVSYNASFQMSRQKICLPTDFDDFDEAELSDGISAQDAAVKCDKADPFDDAFGGTVSTDTFFEVTETVSTFQTLNVTSPATVDGFDRELKSTGFSFSSFDDMGGMGAGTDDFSVDPFGQSGVFDGAAEPMDLTGSFEDASSTFWGSTSKEPTIERRRSVDTASSSNSATKQQRRRNGEAPPRISRRRSSTAGRSNSFQGAR